MSATTTLVNGRPPALPDNLASTPSLKRATTAFTLTLRQKAIMLMDGPPGTGKTTAAARFVEQAIAHEIPAVYVAIPERPSPSELLRLFIEAVSGTPGCGTKHDMENEARALLADFGGLLVVDEVQNLRRSGMQELRYLHDDAQTDIAILLSGWQADKVIRERPDLDSRVRYRARFQLLERKEVCATITQLEPRLHQTADSVLMHIDAIYARGSLRLWHAFICAADDLAKIDGPIDLTIANAIIALLDAETLVAAS